MKSKLICVVNNQEIFDKVVKNNENLKNSEIFAIDNTQKNLGIPKRYNDFIRENVLASAEGALTQKYEGFWCIFIHQDFGITENIDPILEKINPKNIYGATGIRTFNGLFFGKKGTDRGLGLKDEFKVAIGRISQGNNDFNFKPHGLKIPAPAFVETVDCCCIIIHSSLIRKYDLRFDENLDFHMYAEELCYRMKKDHDVKTLVVQMDCFHLGVGNLNDEFKKSAQYLKDKFKIKTVPSTCPN